MKRIVGESIRITAVVYGDGHDHVAARVLYRSHKDTAWRSVRMQPLGNDLWEANVTVDTVGLWHYTVQAWEDHFDTWLSDLKKRLSAQTQGSSSEQEQLRSDIVLALRTGSLHVERSQAHASGEQAKNLKEFALLLRALADENRDVYENPVTEEILACIEANPDLSLATTYDQEFPLRVDPERARFSSWYELFPRSLGDENTHGTLRDVEALLPELAEAGFDVVYMPPIHPIGAAFRKGRNNSVVADTDDVGSPWAIGAAEGGHTTILPELGTFADFDSLIKAARKQKIDLALDIAFQCSPDHPWVKEHPEWFLIRPDGSIQYAENPPKKYQDIYPLNFESKDWRKLWQALCNVFLFWAKRGVRVFRVDNPHTKAFPFWEWCLAEVQKKYPDAIFLAEAFTRPHVMYGLAKRGFTQSYTYFSWRETKQDLTEYVTEITRSPVAEFFRPNFWPNTPDILPGNLQSNHRSAFEIRAVLAATLSASYGVYGPAFELMEHTPVRPGSEEYLDSEKYQLRSWDRQRSDSLMPLLHRLNHVRRQHPALQTNTNIVFHPIEDDRLICYSKRSANDTVLMIVNLQPEQVVESWTDLKMQELGLSHTAQYEVHDLLTEEVYHWQGPHNYVRLNPQKAVAHVLHVRQIAS